MKIRFKKLPNLLLVGAALTAMGLSIANYRLYQHSIKIEEQHYQELTRRYLEVTKPHTLHEELRNKLEMLDKTIEELKQKARLGEGIVYSGDLEREFNELDDILIEAKLLWNRDEFEEASQRINDAYQYLDRMLGIQAVKIVAQPDIAALYIVTINGETIDTAEVDLVWLRIKLVINEGTTILDAKNMPVTSLLFEVHETPPLAQEATIIGHACSFKPDGATFNPPISIIWNYDPEAIPSGISEGTLFLTYWDEGNGKWTAVENSKVNTSMNTVSASIGHFTIFAIQAKAAGLLLPPWSIHLWWGLGVLGAIFFGYWIGKRRAAYLY